MRIVLVSRLFLPHLGGVEIHTHELATLLGRQGHQVTIVTLQHDRRLSQETKKKYYTVIRIPESDIKQVIWREISAHSELFEDADIVHVHDVFWWLLPVYLKIRKKLYITFHGWETSFPIPFNAKLHRLLASALTQGSIHVGDYIQKFYLDTPDVIIYGGINSKRFTKSTVINRQKSSKIEFVFIGRLEEDTAVPKYLDLFKKLQERKIDFSVVWVGDGSLREDCETFGIVTGFVKNTSKYVRFADYVCASSYLSILEAQLLGKIVIAFYSNPLKKEYLELFPGSKHMLISSSVKTMLKKLSHVFSSTKLRTSMETKAKRFAQKQTWEQVLKKYQLLWGYAPASLGKLRKLSSKVVPVSLIVTVLNEENTIEELLKSILRQTALPEEVIIVDGGSTDKTISKISSFIKNHEEATESKTKIVVLQETGNRSIGRNAAIRKATQEYIAITDAGCVLNSHWLEYLYKSISAGGNSVIAGYYQGLPQSNFESAVVPYALVMPDQVDPNNFLPATRSVILHKDVFDRYGHFPEELSDNEDFAFFNYLKSQGVKMGFDKDAIAYWKPRKDIKSFYRMIFRFARGDIQAKLFRPKVGTIFLRYLVFGTVFVFNLFLFMLLFSLYLAWSIHKNKKYTPRGWVYLPVLQITSDIAVMHGSLAGLIRLLF